MKLISKLLLSLSLMLPGIAAAQWYPGYYSYGYNPYYAPYPRVQPYYYPLYVYTAPIVQQSTTTPVNPGLTIPPLPEQISPTGFAWTTVVDSECRCVRWVLVPVE